MINGIDYLKKMYPNRDEKDYQPSGLDLRAGRVFEIDYSVPAGLFNGQKKVPRHIELVPQKVFEYDAEECWVLEPHIPYIVEVDKQIQIGEKNAQFYLPRSTLLRSGVTVSTALGDLGYNGHLSFLVINHRHNVFILQKGERFAQLVDFEVKGGSELYNGDYQEKVVIADDDIWATPQTNCSGE